MSIVRVALDVPVDKLFDYRAPDATPADIGRRVRVPFGRKKAAVGVILEIADGSAVPPARLKSALEILRDDPSLSPEDLRLMRFAADYYRHPLGAVVVSTLPGRLRRLGGNARPRPPASYVLTAAGAAVEVGALPARARAQRALLERLRAGPLAVGELPARGRTLLKRFLKEGWIAPGPAADGIPAEPSAAPALTAEQEAAIAAIRAGLGRFRSYLLLGVTGSGKTE